MRKLRQIRKKNVIVCGIEAHICILQTVLDLLKNHYRVLLVRDSTSSHAPIDRETAIERMRSAGAMIGTTEAVIYELTEKAGTEEFRKILEIVKGRRGAHSQTQYLRSLLAGSFESITPTPSIEQKVPRKEKVDEELLKEGYVKSSDDIRHLDEADLFCFELVGMRGSNQSN